MRKQIKTKQNKMEEKIICFDKDIDCYCVVDLLFKIWFNS
jgi:hypothetical protein